MSACATPLSQLATSRRWQDNFVSILGAIQNHASVRFRRMRSEAKAEATAEAIASACVSYRKLSRQKKLARVFPGNIATFAVQAVKGGRHVGGHQNCRCVLNSLTHKKKGIVVGSLSPFDPHEGSWKDLAVESRKVSPADTACFRLDFQSWLKRWPRRHRQIINALMAGSSTTEVAAKCGVSLPRISQLRREYQDSWERFQGEMQVAA